MNMKPESTHRYRGRIRVFNDLACYHCISRVAGGERLLKAREKEVFRKMLRKQARFCGVEIITFAVMSNHFHLLVRVVPQGDLPDDELIGRVGEFYGDREAKVVASYLANEEKREELRERLLARMGDVSVFLKELKQRFSIWYNKVHDRFGTLWAERFKSVLVQGEDHALAVVAAYIDLNAVRAGLCEDPKDYRFCGYGEAVAGNVEAQVGLQQIFLGPKTWKETQSAYRMVLFGNGYHTEIGKGRIREGALLAVLRKKGDLSRSDLLRCRLRYFSEGLVLGSEEFIEQFFAQVKERYGWRKRKRGAVPMKGDRWNGLCTLSRMRGQTIG